MPITIKILADSLEVEPHGDLFLLTITTEPEQLETAMKDRPMSLHRQDTRATTKENYHQCTTCGSLAEIYKEITHHGWCSELKLRRIDTQAQDEQLYTETDRENGKTPIRKECGDHLSIHDKNDICEVCADIGSPKFNPDEQPFRADICRECGHPHDLHFSKCSLYKSPDICKRLVDIVIEANTPKLTPQIKERPFLRICENGQQVQIPTGYYDSSDASKLHRAMKWAGMGGRNVQNP